MTGSTSPISIIGLVLGLLCHTTGGPVLGTMAATLQAQACERPTTAPRAPAHASVRDFAESTPMAAPAPIAAPQPVADTANLPDVDPTPVQPPAAGIAIPSAAPQPQGNVAGQEMALVGMINEEREAQGENPLATDPLLARIAGEHSEDMCARNYFDHRAPAPGPATPMDRYIAALSQRPDYAMVGENIYYRSATDSPYDYASESNDAFMHSPGHRANILTPEYTSVGVGIYVNQTTGEFWVTEMFLRDSQ
jgi:uncharacterized protein YkwD